jgi:mRNA-degrading endonuclease RelE of RelBE toxin-antitoxin system
MYSVFETLYTPTTIRELRRILTNIARRIMARIEQVAANPAAADNNVSRLKGRPERRLLVGNWRILFAIDKIVRALTV